VELVGIGSKHKHHPNGVAKQTVPFLPIMPNRS
jgi:hypothetical protein